MRIRRRKRYRNRDPITVPGAGCDSCIPCTINGVLSHEPSCPNSWRDYQRGCKACKAVFWPKHRFDDYCYHCKKRMING